MKMRMLQFMTDFLELKLTKSLEFRCDFKSDINNIVDSAKKCSFIDKIILFGSSIDERCTEDSDIDLAIFGNQTKYKCLNSKEYRQFAEDLYSFDDFSQSYDLLYFKTGNTYSGLIINDINNGEVLYVRE